MALGITSTDAKAESQEDDVTLVALELLRRADDEFHGLEATLRLLPDLQHLVARERDHTDG